MNLGGLLTIELGGTGAGLFDMVDVSGLTTFFSGSRVMFDFIDSFMPQAGQSFTFFNSAGGFKDLSLLYYTFADSFGLTWSITNTDTALMLAFASNSPAPPASVSLPSTLWLFGAGLAGLIGSRRRKSPDMVAV